MSWEFVLQSAGQLVLSAVFAAFVGYEREVHGRPAGLRTHILVGVGSTLFTIASVGVALGHPGIDPGRIAAQVVSGIGFLGAGTIIRQGNVVRGLTTAASLWAVAGVGVSIGIGGQMLIVATIATLVIVLTLTILREVERWMDSHRLDRELTLYVTNPKGVFHQVLGICEKVGAEVTRASLATGRGMGGQAMTLRLKSDSPISTHDLTRELVEIPEVITVEWN